VTAFTFTGACGKRSVADFLANWCSRTFVDSSSLYRAGGELRGNIF
jgi:cytidylate kinase